MSKSTVSRALSGKGRISAETRARVYDYVAAQGFPQKTVNPANGEESTRNIAMVIPKHFVRLDLPFFRKCMGGICRMSGQRGYDVILCFVGEDETVHLKRLLDEGKVDGVILSRTLKDDRCVELLKQYGTPFVAIGRVDDTSVAQIDNDQVGAACEMTHILLQMGMKRIAYLGGSIEYTVNHDRLQGYLQAFEQFEMKPLESLIYSGIENEERRHDALEAALEQNPDCLVCCDDKLSAEVLQDLQRRGIKIPGEIKLVSLYDREALASTMPSITALQFDAEQLGVSACRMLMDLMAGRDKPHRQVQGYSVILRDSTK